MDDLGSEARPTGSGLIRSWNGQAAVGEEAVVFQ